MSEQTTFQVAGFTGVVVSDALPKDNSPLADDVVLGVGGAARTLLHITPRIHFNRVWDLGCGSGVQSVIAAQHSDHVIATDIDQRALDFTQQSAVLNNVTIETRLGSLFDPVKNEKFDLIISNPPFVIGGMTQLTHRESPFGADGLTQQLLEGLPHQLTDNGIAVILATWLVTDEDWQERITQWIPNNVGAWVALRDMQHVDAYVHTWMNDAGIENQEVAQQWKQRLAEWNATYVAFGWIVLQAGTEFVTMEDVRHAPALPSGNDVLKVLNLAQAAEDLSAATMLTTPLRQASGESWRGDIGLDSVLAGLYARLDGEKVLPEIVAELAAETGFDEDDLLILSLVGAKRLVGLGLALLD